MNALSADVQYRRSILDAFDDLSNENSKHSGALTNMQTKMKMQFV